MATIKSIEEKAKAYDNAFRIAKELYDNPNSSNIGKGYVCTVFPELKNESEDKRIRKELIKGISKTRPNTNFLDTSITREDALAWLEKQGEQKTTWDKQDEENMNNVLYIFNQLKDTSSYKEDDIAEKTIKWFKALKYRLCSNNEYGKDMLGAIEYCIKNKRPLEKEHIAWLEKQCEQKPDKVEPKFKIGDWIVYDNNLYHIGNIALQICYECLRVDGTVHTFSLDIDSKSHLWTIQDAKDGDVLYCKSDCGIEYIVMSKGLNKHGNIDSYFRYNSIDGFGIDVTSVLSARHDDITPATKEQRDLLFQKMKEAGYEWDAEKKELKKIEQKSAWSEEDDYNAERLLCLLTNQQDNYPQLSCDFQDIEGIKDWVKSLKDRYTWFPSDEQMKALADALSLAKNCGEECAFDLRTLYEQLKKLKE